MNWLRGDRIEILPLERKDLETRVRWLNDPDVQQNLNFEYPVSLTRTEKWFEKAAQDSRRLDMKIRHRENGLNIGICGLLAIDPRSKKAEIYVTIGDKSQWGQGFATETYRVLSHYAFYELGLERIYAFVSAHNEGAKKVMEKLEWHNEGTLRRDVWSHGRLVDRIVFSRLRHEWEEGRSP